MSDTPRVWVGSLAAYNSGRLLGDWFDGDDIPTTAEEWVKRMTVTHQEQIEGTRLDPAEHEELWVFDHEGFHGVLKGECSPETARQYAELIADAEGDHVEPEALTAWAGNIGVDLEGKDWADVRGEFFDAFAGEFDSELDYGTTTADDVYLSGADIPEHIAQYFDYDAFTRDLFMSDVYSVPSPGGGVYVFQNC